MNATTSPFDNAVRRDASPKAYSYAIDLLRTRDLSAEQRPAYRARMEMLRDDELKVYKVDAKGISTLIDTLKPLPRVRNNQVAETAATAQGGEYAVPLGYYAIETEGVVADPVNTLNFYRVRTEEDPASRWHGFLFVDQIVSEERYPVKGAARARVLAAIAEDPQAAMLRYGRETVRCGHCRRRLTNDLSREIGIGPKCRKDMGW